MSCYIGEKTENCSLYYIRPLRLSMEFAQAMTTKVSTAPKGMAYTENGALADVAQSRCLKFYTKVMARDKATAMSDEDIRTCAAEAWAENPQFTLRLFAHLRDCRSGGLGKGERHAAGVCFNWLLEEHPEQLYANLVHLPFYGYYKDLLGYFVGTAAETQALQILAKQLEADKELLTQAQTEEDPVEARKLLGQLTCRPASKWCPTEGCTYDKKSKQLGNVPVSYRVATMLGCTGDDIGAVMKTYRKDYLTPLREATGVVERLLAAQRYDEVDFSKVPSCALKMYSAKCFPKHMAERFAQWQKDVLAGRKKVNTSQVDPYEVVHLLLSGAATEEQKPTLEAFYHDQIKKLRAELGDSGIGDTLCICDTSGSMNGVPLTVAVAMTVWISSLASEHWRDMFLTFNTTPTFVSTKGCKGLEDRVRRTRAAPWGGSTDLLASFRLMLNRGQEHGLTDSEMPKRVVLLTDMQFNRVGGTYGNEIWTTFEAIKAMYRAASYTMPELVCWNLRGDTDDATFASDHQQGVTMISGFSKSMIPAILANKPVPTPYDGMIEVLSNEHYDRMTYVPPSNVC